jgi:hypothetical protein
VAAASVRVCRVLGAPVDLRREYCPPYSFTDECADSSLEAEERNVI